MMTNGIISKENISLYGKKEKKYLLKYTNICIFFICFFLFFPIDMDGGLY